MIEERMAGGYARRVGERLRAIRKQKGLSLQEVEGASQQEFKASVLGAYERGERAISVPRLQRLARFYNVPVDQLLPVVEEGHVVRLLDGITLYRYCGELPVREAMLPPLTVEADTPVSSATSRKLKPSWSRRRRTAFPNSAVFTPLFLLMR